MAKQFNDVPVIKHSRSRFDLSHGVKTSANVGTLYPFELQEVYAGDTFKVKTSVVSRLSSQFLRPVMDNLFLDVYYFFVPSRLLYDKYVNIFGENTESAWANTQEYEAPHISGTVQSKTVGDYLGLPVGMPLQNISVLPFRAFAKIYNEWFRDQNNVSPMHIQQGEVVASENFNNNAWTPSNYFGELPKVAKFHDYFTSCLPAPQKGSAVDLPLVGNAPVVLVDNAPIHSGGYDGIIGAGAPLRFRSTQNGSIIPSGNIVAQYRGDENNGTPIGVAENSGVSSTFAVYPSNLFLQTDDFNAYADLSNVSSFTVNDLRFAFQYQKMLERDSLSGSRYIEYLFSHFGVQAGDYRLQRSEFLGGRRMPLSIHQVVQSTGSGSDSSPLGEVGAYSLSNGRSRYTKSFVENGYVVGVFCIRYNHTYQQGVEKLWKRFKRTDFYDPVFSHIGEQPVYKYQLYGSAPDSGDGSVFGYNEAWAELRYMPNRVSGQMRSGVLNTLDVWHFADNYTNAPTLSQEFIQETPVYVDRAITVESGSQDQFILDFWVQNIAYRVLPTYSVPSLIDHD